MKKMFIILLAFSALAACRSNAKKGAPKDEKVQETGVVIDNHNARNSLDYVGVYEGMLPCADCDGIETAITINADYTFNVKTVYKGKGEGQVFEENGTYTWNEDGNTIILEGVRNAPFKYFVSEDAITQLDLEGNFITGDLEDTYVLKKK